MENESHKDMKFFSFKFCKIFATSILIFKLLINLNWASSCNKKLKNIFPQISSLYSIATSITSVQK